MLTTLPTLSITGKLLSTYMQVVKISGSQKITSREILFCYLKIVKAFNVNIAKFF